MRSTFKLLTLFFIILLVYKPGFGSLSPEIYEQIKKDFSPVLGLLIGIEDRELIIDKGLAQGVKNKDIFTVYKRGKKIVHPETQKTLGYLKEPVAKIEVVRVDEHFATAKVIYQKEPLTVPMPITRYADLKVLILAEHPNPTENLFLILKNNLPDCTIIFDPNLRFNQITPEYLLAEKFDLLFVEEENNIKVYNSKLDLIRYYGGLSYQRVSASTYSKPASPTKAESKPLGVLQPALIGKTKGEVVQAEFADMDNDGTPEMVYFNSQGLFIIKIKGGLLAQYKPSSGKIVNFSVGPAGWIALNVYDERVGMKSEVLQYTNQGLNPVITNINLILNFVDYTARGIKDTLLGQTFDPENFFGKEVFILKRENNQLIYATKLNLYEEYQNIGTVFVDFDLDGQPEILTYLADGRLGIYKNNQLQWTSPYAVVQHFYEVRLTKGKKGQEIVKKIVLPFVAPVVQNVGNKTTVFFASTSFPLETVKKDLKYLPLDSAVSQVFVLGFEGNFYYKNLTSEQRGFITGLGVYDNFIYFTVVKGKYPIDTETELYSAIVGNNP
ncbi:hypothetical protein F1847_03950 [Thermodesulfobacterium sp. TA1]|uniref:hypothetical protein n=1 Tax=Thermodesulfobacterium sp. TA1 TaxID=2234087 RepID=UPI0012323C16|nr:hypothetical protein [Thermodesulfobacterium sp. TA1]QER41937.1 hypothetical protein F1847_03950 [Thermodesulfobacterium sp. TA1]